MKFLKIIGIILFVYILLKVDFNQLLLAFQRINPAYYSIGVLFLAIGSWTRVLRWKSLVNAIGETPSIKDLTQISLKGIFWGLVTPGKLGEFLRAQYLTRITKTSLGKAFYTAFVDRIADILIIVAVGFLAILTVYLKFGGTANFQFLVLVSLFLIFASLIYFLMRKIGVKKLSKALIRFLIPPAFRDRTDHFVEEFYSGFRSLNLKLFLKIFFWGFLYYLFAGVLTNYFITLALGITLPFWYIFLITALTWLAVALPITFLGLGTREAVFIYFFSFFGVPASVSLAVSLLALFSNILILAIPGAVLFVKQK